MRENAPVSVLADRYASTAMRQVFAPEEKIIAERKLWLAVARAQAKLGHAISDAVIADYEKVITKVDLASIDAREKVTRHDVKARIEEFNALAGHEAIHAGMTSRDLTENIEALHEHSILSCAWKSRVIYCDRFITNNFFGNGGIYQFPDESFVSRCAVFLGRHDYRSWWQRAGCGTFC